MDPALRDVIQMYILYSAACILISNFKIVFYVRWCDNSKVDKKWQNETTVQVLTIYFKWWIDIDLLSARWFNHLA